MNLLTRVAGNFAEISMGASALILVLLLAGGAVRKAYAARWKYWVWLALAVRLLVPVHLEIPGAAVALSAPEQSFTVALPVPQSAGSFSVPDVVSGQEREEYQQKADLIRGQEAKRTVPLGPALALLWAAGAAGCLLWTGCSSMLFRRRLLRWSKEEPDGEALRLFREECGTGEKLRLMRCKKENSPMMAGLFRPVLLLPPGPFSGGELRAVFRHELTHFRRHDLWYKLLLAAACAVHWFNPLVWLMAAEANRDLELSCDEAALREAEPAFRAEYGRAVLSVAQKGALRRSALSTCFGSGKKELKRRLETILDTKRKRSGAAALCAVLALAVACGAFVTFGNIPQQSSLNPQQEQALAQKLIQSRTEYLGDASAVGRVLVALPPLPDGIAQKELLLQTSAEPYGLTVSYTAQRDELLTKTDLSWAYRNAMLLLSLIQNAGRVTFQVTGPDYEMTFLYTREQAAKLEQTDVRMLSQSENEMEKFLADLSSRGAADFTKINGHEISGLLTADQAQSMLEKQLGASAQLMLLREQTFGSADFYLFNRVLSDSNQSPQNNKRYAVSRDGSVFLTLENSDPLVQNLESGAKTGGSLPVYTHYTGDAVESAVYRQLDSQPYTPGNVVINAPIIYGSFEENGVLRVFATVDRAEYELDGDVLNPVGESMLPMELRFVKDGAQWKPAGRTSAKDGSYFADSIRDFCAPHGDVAKKMLSDYGKNDSFFTQMKKNLQEYVTQSGIGARYVSFAGQDRPIFS